MCCKQQFIRFMILIGIFVIGLPSIALLHRNKLNQTQQQAASTTPAQKSIIIDLSGVLFKEDASAVIKKVGFFRIARYAFWKDPADGFLTILEKMSKEKDQIPPVPLHFRGRPMPLCIIEWQQGKKTYTAVQKDINNFIEKLDKLGHFSNSNEKNVMQSILEISFDPEQLYEITKPDSTMITMIEQLKKKGYKLYALSNCSKESFNSLKKHYPKLLKNFDGLGLSHEFQMIKPEKKIFEAFIKKYNLDPKHCLIIDNQKETMMTVKQFGMETLLFTNPKECKQELIKRGIL